MFVIRDDLNMDEFATWNGHCYLARLGVQTWTCQV